MGVHEDQHLPLGPGSTKRAAPSDAQPPRAPDQTHPAQVRHVLAEHALQVIWRVEQETSTQAEAGGEVCVRVAGEAGDGDSPCWLRSSTRRTSRRCCLGAVSSTLCTVRSSVDQASLWKQMTTEAGGSDSLYCPPKHLSGGEHELVSETV